VWPAEIMRAPDCPSLVYLDLNHWINLAKARAGKVDSESYVPLLDSCRKARARGVVAFPLSIPFVEEFSAIAAPRQRDEIVDLIDELTDFEYLAGAPEVMQLELQALLDERTGTSGFGFRPINIIGKSMLTGLGMVGGLRIYDASGADVTDQSIIDGGPTFARRFADMNRTAERDLLRGPRDEEIAPLRAAGYRPEVVRQRHLDNTTIEQWFADTHLNEHWRKGRLLDVLAARHATLELIDMLTRELMQRGVTLTELVPNFRNRYDMPLAMPSSMVWVAIKTHYHRDATRKWTPNDLYDIAALGVAVPYCDVVFTDRAVRNAIRSMGVDSLMHTHLPRTPLELAALLDDLPDSPTAAVA
jgi:hypothetical protein